VIKRWGPAGLFAALCGLFFIVNRGAYRGYFQDDELDNLSWGVQTHFLHWLSALVTPRFLSNNFRPVGHALFIFGGQAFGLHFAPYVAVIHLLHLMTALLILLLARRMQLAWPGVFAATAFFLMSGAFFDAVWKPMYCFDVLCGLLCMASILFYAERRWVLSFLCFWLAYKSKELAVMLPVVLALYEYLLGERKWLRLVPFFAVALSFGLQSRLLNAHADDAYTFRFNRAALAATLPFYLSRLLLIPYAGVLLLAVPLIVRDRRAWWSVASLCLFLLPLLFLPGRLFGAYCYLPLAAGSIGIGLAASRIPVPYLIALLSVWVAWNVHDVKQERRAKLAIDTDIRNYSETLQNYAATHPVPLPLVFQNRPLHFAPWGQDAAVRFAFRQPNLQSFWFESAEGTALRQHRFTLLLWNTDHHQLEISEQN
jgi:hypothetical protein